MIRIQQRKVNVSVIMDGILILKVFVKIVPRVQPFLDANSVKMLIPVPHVMVMLISTQNQMLKENANVKADIGLIKIILLVNYVTPKSLIV